MRRMRILNILCIFCGWALLICCRLTFLQVIEHHKWTERAARQQERTFEVAPRRGILYDRNLQELAMTVLADSVYAVPTEVGANRPADAAILAKIVHTDPDDHFTTEHQILARMMASKNFAWVARKQPPAVVAKIKALNLKGIYFQKEFKRFYPDQQLAAQVLGYVGLDDDGLGGIEQRYDEELHGTPGRVLTAIDARRHVLDSEEHEPLPGENLVLSIDANIQFMAERALDENMERTHAVNGTVVVQDPHTGQILALAMRPTFDPNDFRHTNPALLRDHAVSDVYEPGSTFKLVSYSAALEEHVTTPDAQIRTLGGQINVAGRIVHDDRDAIRYEAAHGNVLSTTEALEQSSDVAAIELAQRMGVDRFYKYIVGYGFGERSGIELPGETRGLVKPPRRWQPTTIGSIPMGQEIGVTPIQLITMASTIANGGMYLPPHVLLESTDDRKGSPKLKPATFRPEAELPNPLPEGAHRVISELTAAEMRRMMEGVVLYGTGRSAQLNGYSAAGKTGTAQKIDPATHTYSKTKYVASFVGFAPVNNPAVTIAVVMDSPAYQFHYGTAASAPVFQKLAQQILEYLGVPHDEDLKPATLVAKDQNAAPEAEDEPQESPEDLNSLFAEVNHLPQDDPLREQADGEGDGQSAGIRAQGSGGTGDAAGQDLTADVMPKTPEAAAPEMEKTGREKTGAEKPDGAVSPSVQATAQQTQTAAPGMAVVPSMAAVTAPAAAPKGSVSVPNKKVAVPSFAGESVRQVVVQAGSSGLAVQVLGWGIARAQAPAAGTMVPAGTDVVVRFTQQPPNAQTSPVAAPADKHAAVAQPAGHPPQR
ncbi:penicillin-binding protein [Acidipila sp. 4G-K13]|uniref:Penicillin-binding protein n=2 Tax=Paracidobacterium acidisoli TaxID=2303751 RepID=A0A372ILG4_9BACT|nr:penicillin-binding protein [Paracidobacterium acidisoli]